MKLFLSEPMFAAYLSLDGLNESDQIVAKYCSDSVLPNFKQQREIWKDSRAVLIQSQVVKHKQVTISHHKSGIRLVSWSRIDNKAELGEKLNGSLIEKNLTDDEAIIASYITWGTACCEHLIGDFSFLIYDPNSELVFFARDQIGVRPLYFYKDKQRLLVASSVQLFEYFPNWDRELNEEWMARYIIDRSPDWRQTAYKNINKVPPANYCLVDLNKRQLLTSKYFEFKSEADLVLKNDEAYVEKYQELLNQAVKCRIEADEAVGSELSGGLDSSSVTALVAKNMSAPGRLLHAFGGSEGKVAFDCVFEFTQHIPMSMFHFQTARSQSFMSSELEWECYGMPMDNGTVTASSSFLEGCRQNGVSSLFSGFAGDEFVTSEAPVALVEFWKEGRYKLFLSRLRGNWLTKPIHIFRWLVLFYKYKNNSITSRRLMSAGELGWSLNPIKQSVISRYDLRSRYFSVLKYDAEKNTQNEFALQDRLSPYLVARLETSALIAAHYGVEYKWPLLDVRLLSFFLSVPSDQKLGPKQLGRYLHRRAVANLMPKRLSSKGKEMISINFFEKAYSALVGNARFMFKMKKQAKKNNLNQLEKKIAISREAQDIKGFNSIILTVVDEDKVSNLFRKSNSNSRYEKQSANHQLSRIKCLSEWLSTIEDFRK